MSAHNLHLTKGKAANKMTTKSLTTSSTLTTYTARTGIPSDNFQVDEFIRVTSSDGNNMAITVGSGYYYGQPLTVLFEVEANAETVDVTCTTGDNGTQLTAAGGYNEFRWHGSTIGWCLINSSAT
jgi:hypothetical protein